MNRKLLFSLMGLLIMIGAVASIFSDNDQEKLLKIDVPMIVLGSYFMGSFLVSYIFDRIVISAREKGLHTVNPYQLLIRINPYINWFVFGFFGFICTITILLLLFVA